MRRDDLNQKPEDRVRVSGEWSTAHQRSMVELFRPYGTRLVAGALVLLATGLLQLWLPRLINQGIDLAEGREVQADLGLRTFGVEVPEITHVVTLVIVLSIVAALLRTASRMFLFQVGRDVERDLRRDLFTHLSHLSPTFFGRHPTGDLMSRTTNDLSNIRLLAGFALLNALNATMFFVGNLPLLFAIDTWVALAALVPFPVVIGFSRFMSRSMYKRTRENQKILGALTSFVQENLAGQQVVRAFVREEAEAERYARVNDDAYHAAMRLAMIRLVMFPLTGLMVTLGIAITLWMAGNAVVQGRMDVGDFVEFNARLFQLTWPTIALGFIISVYQRGRASLERVNEVLSARPDIVDGEHQAELVGEIRAENLHVRYDDSAAPALDGVSFRVNPGATLGIVGRNASGKTTLVRALSRLCVVPNAVLYFDDVDVNDWSLSSLHNGIAIVPDDGFLFSASLRENLTFGFPEATDEEVEEIIDIVDLRRDVEGFPDGLKTLIGERGVTLSGGQRQRVSLGRALLARPRVLILDDCLSAVDAETETNIVRSLRDGRFARDQSPPALLIVSHRLSAVRNADEIIVLDAGKVHERGDHAALLQNDGIYADLWGREQLKQRMASSMQESK